MKRHTLAPHLFALFVTGCATTQPPAFLIQSDRRPETRPLPPDPSAETLPTGTQTNADWVEPLEAGSCLDAQGRPLADAPRPCPVRSGIAVGEARAARDAMYRIRYRELRLVYESDREVWGVQRSLYEGQLGRADQHIRSLQPSWFQQNALGLGIAGGFMLGAAACISIFAVTSAAARPTGP